LILAAISKHPDPFKLGVLATGMSAVLGKLEPGDARRAYESTLRPSR
jgi:hypothetical protein